MLRAKKFGQVLHKIELNLLISIKNFSLLLRFIIFYPLFLVIAFCVKPIVTIRVGEIESRVFGHFIHAPDQYLSECDFGIHNNINCVDLFYINGPITNSFVMLNWKNYFSFYPAFILEPIFKFLLHFEPNSKHLVPFRHWRNSRYWQTFDLYNVNAKTKPHINFSKSEELISNEILLKNGIKKDDKIVCFFSRSSNYYGDESPRNSSINLFCKAINFLCAEGYKCIRVGNSASEKFNLELGSIYDYALSGDVSDLMDLYLISKCEFMISTCSGIDGIAHVFRRPTLYVNYLQWGGVDCYTEEQVPLFIPKLLKWKINGRLLTLEEIVQFRANELSFQEQYEDLGVEVIENSEDEILSVVEEYIYRLKNIWTESPELGRKQKDFVKNMRHDKRVINQNTPKIGSSFLRKYNEILMPE